MLCKPDIRLVYLLACLYRLIWGTWWIRLIIICAAVLACALAIFYSLPGSVPKLPNNREIQSNSQISYFLISLDEASGRSELVIDDGSRQPPSGAHLIH